ncbi:MAG TPA: hypothetical protein VJ952_06280, partial [Opitutales bacterium]|nr:hypothetical protein [Opitutales bacterium]
MHVEYDVEFGETQKSRRRNDGFWNIVRPQINSFKECSGAATAVPVADPIGKVPGTTIRLCITMPGQVIDPLRLYFVKKL